RDAHLPVVEPHFAVNERGLRIDLCAAVVSARNLFAKFAELPFALLIGADVADACSKFLCKAFDVLRRIDGFADLASAAPLPDFQKLPQLRVVAICKGTDGIKMELDIAVR